MFPRMDEQMATGLAALDAAMGPHLDAARCLFVPYRIVPLGAHVDHQGGHVLGRTIPAGTVLAYAPLAMPEIRLASANFPEAVDFSIGAPVQPKHWSRYAQAAALVLGEDHPLPHGLTGIVIGILPGAGLGSSASVGIAYLQALADVNGITLSDADLVELDYRLEHVYLGLDNGIADQSVILFGSDAALTQFDVLRRQSRPIPDTTRVAGSGWLIAYSGVRRELTAGGAFNQRVAECRAAAQWLDPTAETLGDVSRARFAAQSAAMPETLRRRATHHFSEVLRVSEGAAAWQVGDLARFGALMDASCHSSIYHYQSGHRTTIALHEIMSAAASVYGSRFSGGGYGGCVIALAEGAQAEAAADEIMNAYRRRFPDQARDAAIYWVANGGAI